MKLFASFGLEDTENWNILITAGKESKCDFESRGDRNWNNWYFTTNESRVEWLHFVKANFKYSQLLSNMTLKKEQIQ